MDNNLKKENIFRVFTYFCLALALISTMTNMIYTILSSNTIADNLLGIIISFLLVVVAISLILINLFFKSKRIRIFNIICSILLALYSIIGFIFGITTQPDTVIDFTGMDIKEVVLWAEERDILIEQTFKNSDTIEKYKVISQNIKAGTNTEKIEIIKVVVSDGFDEEVITEVDSMIGWKLDDVINFIDENHLTNVTILFEFSNTVEKDIIIRQDVFNDIKRNEPITLVSSLGKESELKYVTMEDLVGLDTFHALVYLGRNNLSYEIEYNYSDKDEGIVLKQSVDKWEVINPNNMKDIVITISKKDKITVPDLTNMTATEINTWATNNRLKIEFTEEYDDTIKLGKVISSNYKKGSLVQIESTIEIVLSKGQLRMINFTTLDKFEEWAEENDVVYDIEYQYNNEVESGKLISISHSKNQIIKNDDIVKLVISQGGDTTIPNLVGMTMEEAKESCDEAKITCKFIYENDNTEYNIVTKQSIKNGSDVPIGTTVKVTLGK